MNPKLLLSLVVLPLFTAPAQNLTPEQIMDGYNAAHETLDFTAIASSIHPGTLAQYRKITMAILQHAQEQYGDKEVLAFFQELKSLDDLKNSSDAQYWAYLMASAYQFSAEKPIQKSKPLGEIKDEKDRLLLVYKMKASLNSSPELGSFTSTAVYIFEKDKGQWKLATYEPQAFESSLYWFLQQAKKNTK
jgi:hypothetical protein